jgi:hypothetical protein
VVAKLPPVALSFGARFARLRGIAMIKLLG